MEKLEGAELQVGYCNACGQARQFQTSGGVGQKQLDEWATDECKCEEGMEERRIKRSQKKAEENIKTLFGTDFPETAAVLNNALPFILVDRIESITIKTGYGIDAKISITNKGKVKVEKKESRKIAYEG